MCRISIRFSEKLVEPVLSLADWPLWHHKAEPTKPWGTDENEERRL